MARTGIEEAIVIWIVHRFREETEQKDVSANEAGSIGDMSFF